MSKDKITVNMNIHDIPILVEELEKANKEIERLNNIIDKLEKYMLERRLTDIDGRTMVYQILDKLNELKGDNK